MTEFTGLRGQLFAASQLLAVSNRQLLARGVCRSLRSPYMTASASPPLPRQGESGQINMIVSAWNNGKANTRTGGGYGIKMRRKDRDNHFRRTWPSVIVELENGQVLDIAPSPSFWRNCAELRRKEIGKWMLDDRLAPWPKGRPPTFRLMPTGDRRFRLSRL